MQNFVLASGSKQRFDLLTKAGIAPIAVSPDIDETQKMSEDVTEFVKRLATEKVKAVEKILQNDQKVDMERSVLLGADTVVFHNGSVLGKPNDAAHAKEMLMALSGNSHIVYSGVAIKYRDNLVTGLSKTLVNFRIYSIEEIDSYLSLGEYVGKAGGCCIQGNGADFVESIEGSYNNVVGLPLEVVNELFVTLNLDLLGMNFKESE